MKQNLSQRGHAHLALILLIVASIVGAVGFEVYASQSASKLTSGSIKLDETAVAKAKTTKKKKKNSNRHGYIKATTKELVKNKRGKFILKKRGNVRVQILSKSSKAKCRDDNKKIVPKYGVVYSRITDGDKKHKSTFARTKADSCSFGTYKIRPVLKSTYELVDVPRTTTIGKKKRNANVTMIIARKSLAKGGAAPVFTGGPVDQIVTIPLAVEDGDGIPIDDFDDVSAATLPPDDDGYTLGEEDVDIYYPDEDIVLDPGDEYYE